MFKRLVNGNAINMNNVVSVHISESAPYATNASIYFVTTAGTSLRYFSGLKEDAQAEFDKLMDDIVQEDLTC
jgi:large exoprotein involved in heme utilization and adhesion